MEFPDDVLQHIRAYAKPWFKHYKLYKTVLALMGRNSFPELRTCLVYHLERILPILNEFIQAHMESMAARDAYLPPDSKIVVYRNQMEYYMSRRNLHACHDKVVRESKQWANLKQLQCTLIECKLVAMVHA